MSDSVIQVENLGKRYRIGQRERYLALRDVLTEAAKAPFRALARRGSSNQNMDNFIWALKNVSFKVKQGETLGIIGRNGAGKSTLLKVLSQITEPTEGRATLHGRVASLLEVGTGFHPELTGRENIFLNGAILGMSRKEINRQFDEIVAFAEIEKFIDTPVKRYSSGMYVRLAFAVAAHLEPEILMVDEVLAVGDAAFQKKCLGKMGNVAKEGRTILFVSHNMQAIRLLCQRALLLQEGSLDEDDNAELVVTRYLGLTDSIDSERTWPEAEAPGDENLKLIAIRVTTFDGIVSYEQSSDHDIFIEMHILIRNLDGALKIGFDLFWQDETVILTSLHNDGPPHDWPDLKLGVNILRCRIPAGMLNGGRYGIAPRISIHCVRWIVHEPPCVEFNVRILHGESHFWMVPRPGVISPIFQWRSSSGGKL